MQKIIIQIVFRRWLLLFLIILWPFFKVSSQDYFNQEVNYRIRVTLNDRTHELNGFETVEYVNN